VVLHARDVTVGKPNPKIYLKAADKLGLKIEDCFIFEDSPVGAEAAQRAGSPTLIITTTHSKSEFTQFPNVVKFIKDYSELDFNQLLNMEALK
jgi:beta-phosphoglucomutase-like phosphatase (HAD superfamily)